MSRSVGPFTAGMEANIPLWLAVSLRKRGLARIIPPSFMTVESLEHILKYERENNTFCAELPHRHSEIARAVLSVSGGGGATMDDGDIVQPELVRTLLEDIETVRIDKIRNNIKKLSEQSLSKTDTLPAIDVTGIGSLEIQQTRPFLTEAFKWHRNASGRGSSTNYRGQVNKDTSHDVRQSRFSTSTTATLDTTFDESTIGASTSINPLDNSKVDDAVINENDTHKESNEELDSSIVEGPRSRIRRFR